MTVLTARIPDALYQCILQLTTEEAISLDQLVETALTAQLSAWDAKQYLTNRARRGDWNRFQAILDKVPDREPTEEDRLYRLYG
jgi:hypothetical protein